MTTVIANQPEQAPAEVAAAVGDDDEVGDDVDDVQEND